MGGQNWTQCHWLVTKSAPCGKSSQPRGSSKGPVKSGARAQKGSGVQGLLKGLGAPGEQKWEMAQSPQGEGRNNIL